MTDKSAVDQNWELPPANGDSVVDKIEKFLPKPVVFRASLVAVLALVGAVVGRDLLPSGVVDSLLDVYTVSIPLLIGLYLRRKTLTVGEVAGTVKDIAAAVENQGGKHRKPE